MNITGGINEIKNKGAIKSTQEGIHNGGTIQYNRVAHGVTDVLLAPISPVDASKTIVCSPVTVMDDETKRTTMFPVVKDDGIYFRHINGDIGTATYSVDIEPFYWKIVELY